MNARTSASSSSADSASGPVHPHPHVEVHPSANELIEPGELEPDRDAPLPPDETHPARQTKRKVGWLMLAAVGGVVVAAAIVAAVFFRTPTSLWFAAGFAVVYAILLLAPVLLAIGTKASQDEKVRDERARRR